MQRKIRRVLLRTDGWLKPDSVKERCTGRQIPFKAVLAILDLYLYGPGRNSFAAGKSLHGEVGVGGP